jgi:CTP synthase
MTKYIFITGGVISGLGKGVISASLGAILREMGYDKFTIKKLDPYLNVDPGTMNPTEHGEVFVTRDGAETDLDLGYYERIGGIITTKENSTSSGKLYKQLIDNERKGKYLGKTVQVIPHFTNEIKNFIKQNNEDYDLILCEIGGSVGDIEAMAFYEALRQIKNEEDTMFVHLTYLVHYKITDELKTKPTQNALKELMQTGIRPDILICRSEKKIDRKIKEKLSLYSNLAIDKIISAENVDSIYKIPYQLIQQQVDHHIKNYFNLNKCGQTDKWKYIYNNINNKSNFITIGIVGKYVELADAYKSLIEAINHVSYTLHLNIKIKWINARDDNVDLKKDMLEVDCIIVPGGFGDTGINKIIEAIRIARKHKIPFLGICLGMQLSVIEYMRNVIGNKNSGSTEFGDYEHNIIKIMQNNTELGGTMRLGSHNVNIRDSTLAQLVYNKNKIMERHRHRYDVNTKYVSLLENNGLIVSGLSDNGLVEIIELPKEIHPYFIACQYHPEYESSINDCHPLFLKLVQSCL